MMHRPKRLIRSFLDGLVAEVAVLVTLRRPRIRVRALLVKPDRLGDFAIVAPLIQNLVDNFGADQVALVVSEANRELARRLFPGCVLVEIPLYLPSTRWAAWREAVRVVADVQAEQAFLFRHRWRHPHLKAVWRMVRAKKRFWIGSARDYVPRSRADRWFFGGVEVTMSASTPATPTMEFALARLLLTEAYGPQREPRPLPAPASVALKAAAGNAPEGAVLFPFSNDPLRDLPLEMAVEIVRELRRTHGLATRVCGPRARQAELQRICDLATPGAVGDLRPLVLVPADFDEFYGVFFSSRIVVSTDTGPAHIAVIHDRPMVGILGGGQYGVYAPWAMSERQMWVNHALPCYGCDWYCKFEKAHCVTDIPHAAIFAAIAKVLALPPVSN